MVLSLAEAGRNIVSLPELYGTTHTLFSHVLSRFGVTVRFAASEQAEDVAALIDNNTVALFCESISNPGGTICDLEALAALAHRHSVPLIVDNTVGVAGAAPAVCVRRRHRCAFADQVHRRPRHTLGGAIIDSGRFPWAEHAERFPALNTPDPGYHGLIYASHFAQTAFIERCRNFALRTTGAVLAPLSAFLLLQGLETLSLRVERHVQNARDVANFLRRDPRVAWVRYAGFPDNPNYAKAEKYLAGQVCSLLSFGVRGGLEQGEAFYDALRLVKRVVNLGDAKSLACHPALDHPSSDDGGRAAPRWGNAGADPPQHRHRTYRRYYCRSRSGAGWPSGRDEREGCGVMPYDSVFARDLSPSPKPAGTTISIGLVNMMPKATMPTMAARYERLLVAEDVALRCFAPGGADAGCEPIEALWNARLDGIIVTGTEPRADNMTREPAWPLLRELVDWAADNVVSAIWSCFSAHAAVYRLDGLPRQRLPDKLSGVFSCGKLAGPSHRAKHAVVLAGAAFPAERTWRGGVECRRLHIAVRRSAQRRGGQLYQAPRQQPFPVFAGPPGIRRRHPGG